MSVEGIIKGLEKKYSISQDEIQKKLKIASSFMAPITRYIEVGEKIYKVCQSNQGASGILSH